MPLTDLLIKRAKPQNKPYTMNNGKGLSLLINLTMSGKGLSAMLKEYGLNYDKRRTNQGMQTNLTLKEENNGDWLPECDDPAAT